jgi:UDPglucose--hexose-1-phosphate uridylyltransferase
MARVPEHPAIVRSYICPPEWRMNPVTGEWVIIAPERSSRPMLLDVHEDQPPAVDEPCPFCAGNERFTPPELQAIREAGSAPNEPGWRVRAVPNSYPAVKELGEPRPVDDGFSRRMNCLGRHELIIECPQHQTNLSRLGVEQVREVVQLWRERMLDCRRDPNLHYAQLFKNHGSDAGASVEHAHSQLIATTTIPRTVREELRFAARFHEESGKCCYCELFRREKADGSRAVFAAPGFAAFTAYAGRQPFETWIVPESHRGEFELISATEIDNLGTVLWTVLRKLDLALDGPPFNLVFHTAPFHEPPLPYYHWHVEVLPRLTQLAGYEWGSGSYINPIVPEDAAVVLRETDQESGVRG